MELDLNTVDDNELLLLLSDGNKAAFDALYSRYWKKVYNSAFKRVRDEGIAKDVAQDVFIQLWTRQSKLPVINVGAYLEVAARNSVFKQIEKASKYSSLSDILVEPESNLGHADTMILHAEFLDAFQQLIQSLPPQQQLIFNLKFNEGLSSQQIAEKLDLSVKTVRNQMGRALTTLRQSFFLGFILYIISQK
jgi:RNA polymerase sigma-70 factor (family 1)